MSYTTTKSIRDGGTWYKSAVSGLWYQDPRAAGSVSEIVHEKRSIPLANCDADLEQRIEELEAENERLAKERHVLAMLSADTPQFYNPLHVVAAKELRDKVLAEALSQKGGGS